MHCVLYTVYCILYTVYVYVHVGAADAAAQSKTGVRLPPASTARKRQHKRAGTVQVRPRQD